MLFVLPHWRKEPLLVKGPIEYSTAWLFWFDGFGDRLMLWLGSDPKSKEACEKLKTIASSDARFFRAEDIGRERYGWPTIWSREFLNAPDFERLDREQIFKKLRERWQVFRDGSLPSISKLLSIGARPA
jgi:hypothetical protein